MALSFNGTTATVSHGDINALDAPSAFTIAFNLFQAGAPALNDAYLDKRSAGTNGFVISSRSAVNDFACSIQNAGDNFGRAVGALVANVRAHWTVAFNGAGSGNAGRLQIYKNGRPLTLTFTGTIPAVATSSGVAALAVAFNVVSSAFTACSMSHLKIWTVALTAAEVRREWQWRQAIRERDLRLLAPYDNSATDYSGYGHHGTITAATMIGGPRILRPTFRSKFRLSTVGLGRFLPFMHPSLQS